MFVDIAIYGHSDHRMDILIKFALKTTPEYIYINYLPDQLGCHMVLIEPFCQASMVKWLMVCHCLYKHHYRRLHVQSLVGAFC
jgi:hypothetical protein